MDDNEIKTLKDYKRWKDSVPVLSSPVIGIEILFGSGCSIYNFLHECQQEVTTHMRVIHSIEQKIAPISCFIQRVFSSHLHGFWRIRSPMVKNNQSDEGLFMLHQFSREFQRFAQEDNRSAIGIYLLLFKANK